MPNFEATDEQWELMKKHIKSDKYGKKDFFVFETLAVGDKVVPNRYMKLTPELLNVMKEDAKKGVSLMLNHNWSQLGVQSIPIGKVFDARIDGPSQDGETTTLYTTQYILKDDSKVDGYSKNDIIKLIETGTLADTSIGWGTTRESYKCSICGNSIYDFANCKHIPGKKYIVNEETNEVKECIIEANPPKHLHAGNNVLMENSIVFDGAYPNAIIQSSLGQEIDTSNGKLKVLEGKQELSEKDIIFGYSTNGSINLLYKQYEEKGGFVKMDNEVVENAEVENEVLNNESTETVETVETETVETPVETTVDNAQENEVTETPEATTEEVAEETTSEKMYTEKELLEQFGNISESLEGLVQLAKEGSENRKEVIQSALESGVHSMGNAFNKEIFEKTFSSMQTKDIKEMGTTWQKQADNQFVKPKVSTQELSAGKEEFKRVDMTQFKTSIY